MNFISHIFYLNIISKLGHPVLPSAQFEAFFSVQNHHLTESVKK